MFKPETPVSLRTLQWNIGGAKIRPRSADPEDLTSYTIDGLDYVVDTIGKHNPDIVTLQEVHGISDYQNQAAEIAKQLDLNYQYFNLSPSHLDDDSRFGIAILSKFILAYPEKVFFQNPNWTHTQPDGSIWSLHDKGALKARVQLSFRQSMKIATAHAFPAHMFNQSYDKQETEEVVKDIRQTLTEDIKQAPIYLIQGDLNVNAQSITQAPLLARRMAPIFMSGVPIDKSTLVTGETVDHILFRNLNHHYTHVLSTRSDHRLLVSEFETRA